MENLWLVYDSLSYLIGLTFHPEVLWNIIPLAAALILIVLYFGVFRGEKPGWGSYVSNTLVLIFVSMNLLRYVYELGGGELGNLIDFPSKTGAALFLLLVSLLLLRFNFGRIFPKKVVAFITSTVTVNLIAYIMILFVYSEREITAHFVIALILLFTLLYILINLSRKPLSRLNYYFEKIKLKERLEDIKEAKFQTLELKEEVKEREKELKEIKKKEIDEKEKEVKKFKEIFRGLFPKKHHKKLQKRVKGKGKDNP
jgi:hypothetical protein